MNGNKLGVPPILSDTSTSASQITTLKPLLTVGGYTPWKIQVKVASTSPIVLN